MQPLNYAVHAVEQLRLDRQWAIRTNRELGPMYDAVIELLCESVKFILPNRAELVDLSELRQAHVDMARLPYPVVAFESTWTDAERTGGAKLAGERSSRRIALCMTLTAELAERVPGTRVFLQEPEGGVLVIPISLGGWPRALEDAAGWSVHTTPERGFRLRARRSMPRHTDGLAMRGGVKCACQAAEDVSSTAVQSHSKCDRPELQLLGRADRGPDPG